MTQDTRRKTPKTGVTLIELVMVVVILSISGLIVVPRLVNFLKIWDLENEAKRMRAKIREAQQLAITKQKRYRLEFDTNTESFDINECDSGGGFCALWQTVKLQKNIEIESTTFTIPASDTLDFNYFGEPSQAGSIILKDSKGNPASVNITLVTGRITIE